MFLSILHNPSVLITNSECFASWKCAAGSLLQGANDVWKWYTCMKACQQRARGEGCLFRRIQLAGVDFFFFFLASRSHSDTDPITMTAPRTPPPSASIRHRASWTVHSQVLVILWKESQLLIYIWCAGEAWERRLWQRAFSHILLNVFHFNHPLLFISPVPLSSQVRLASIQKFNSALERVGLYLKPSCWINWAEIL